MHPARAERRVRVPYGGCSQAANASKDGAPNFEALEAESETWQKRRNIRGRDIDSNLTTDGTRVKPKRPYPVLQE